ncbi:hypothetical protein PENANT_c153G05582 [Penicillium antarcticum]|uniref:Uncharacterized protein n=1 Tax=Penicillium antarcticum TaxID=416450 RepID=A0A1V6PEN2_9EURO|nr:hypothetical protein PENANT_c153G05582 [Penicillium antarcticum]
MQEPGDLLIPQNRPEKKAVQCPPWSVLNLQDEMHTSANPSSARFAASFAMVGDRLPITSITQDTHQCSLEKGSAREGEPAVR